MQHFDSKNVWMTIKIMVEVFTALDCKLDVRNRKDLSFLDNAPSHSKNFQGNLKNTKLVFLPKNNTSELQPCNTSVIRNFKVKYRKQLLKHVISRINDGKTASEIFQES